eukprot:scaffold37790_cov28-Tisochrysis_lutea.AAC.1
MSQDIWAGSAARSRSWGPPSPSAAPARTRRARARRPFAGGSPPRAPCSHPPWRAGAPVWSEDAHLCRQAPGHAHRVAPPPRAIIVIAHLHLDLAQLLIVGEALVLLLQLVHCLFELVKQPLR